MPDEILRHREPMVALREKYKEAKDRVEGLEKEKTALGKELYAVVKKRDEADARVAALETVNAALRDATSNNLARIEELEKITNNAVGIGPGDTVLCGTAKDCEIVSEWLATHTYEDEQIDAAVDYANTLATPAPGDDCANDGPWIALNILNIFRCENRHHNIRLRPIGPCPDCTGHGWVKGADND
ncbi:hypothetical protein LCGC14_0344630 [marine sediment metagenome]|uniref:Uncharacterized protein n=1 Tax=marine sediment metagenome TaxID=412755 RepID=A0A0F9TVK0_9ZZZZ